MNQHQLDFFLGSLTPVGFQGYFSEAASDPSNQTVVLLKSGPGCGKSTILHQVADYLLGQGETVELIHCAADPESLDGVICSARRFMVLDATPPHAEVSQTQPFSIKTAIQS